ncbi:hypothetical protein P691DRAFT_805486 [Macrolepiota fuliginosa MF-IS2]|uniref:NACHT domain-containing protein n=1 Tax=Macrolepiota fuliginosa MF-IS2 TaxID=1400762 RepID=A0A9P5X6W6_9AGAR|nr:hypothetical protein P691DRAFT_805486 [Macrolepiota fuliginosa MF-IS2]
MGLCPFDCPQFTGRNQSTASNWTVDFHPSRSTLGGAMITNPPIQFWQDPATQPATKRKRCDSPSLHEPSIAGNREFVSPPPRHAFPTPPQSPTVSSNSTLSPHSPSPGFFQKAHSFQVNNSTFIDHSTTVQTVQNMHPNTKKDAIQELAGHGMSGAEFDSLARHPVPRCLHGTREKIIHGVCEWITKPEPKMLWLRGSAGVGKSAIMQTVAEKSSQSAILGATLFFSRANQRSKLNHVVPTLAYQLATHIPSYRLDVEELIGLYPTIFEKSVANQFQKFIIEPFLAPRPDQQTFLILIDGLDECESERDQCELVELIALAAGPTSPFVWIISSRPEYHLLQLFRRPGFNGIFKLQHVPIDGPEAYMDVERHLRKGFDRIQEEFSDMIPPHWPSERQFMAIKKATRGLFAQANTLLRFVGDGSLYGDPISQLEIVLAELDKHQPNGCTENPLASLDALYNHILSTVPSTQIPTLQHILGFCLLRERSSSISLLLTANVLGMRQNVVYGALQRLHSVLDIPQPQEAHQKPIRFLHKSFSDYLTNPKRSGCFFLDTNKQSLTIMTCYIRMLGVALESGDDTTDIPLSWSRPAEADLGRQVIREVKENWSQILSKIFNKWDPRHQHAAELEELLEVFVRLQFNAFDVRDALGFINIINWIADGTLPTMRNRLVIGEVLPKDFDLDQVDNTRTSVFYRTKPDRWGYWSTNTGSLNVAGSYSSKQPQHYLQGHLLSQHSFFEDFRSLQNGYVRPDVKVLIIGSDPSKRCAVVLSAGDKWEARPVIRYYLPLRSAEYKG